MKNIIFTLSCLMLLTTNVRAQQQSKQDTTSLTTSAQGQQGWTQISVPTTTTISIIAGTKSDTVWARSDGGFLFSMDRGLTWVNKLTPILAGSIAFYSSQIGYINYFQESYRTKNGGMSWDSSQIGFNGAGNLQVLGPDTVFGIYLSGISRTTDGGLGWKTYQVDASSLNAISFSDALHGFAVSNEQIVNPDSHQVAGVWRTKDGGNNWQELYSGIKYDLHGVCALSNSVVLVIGKGAIYRSTDSGMTWHETILTSAVNPFFGIRFLNSQIGIIVGGNGVIFFTSDGGLNWTPESSGVTTTLYDAAFVDDTTIVVVGDKGTILRTTTLGLASVNTQPTYQSLSVQTFPNPSSSSTQFSFILPEPQHVTLSIYNIDGALVQQLLNQQFLPTGVNQAVFDGSPLPSGTYTYQFNSERYHATGQFQLVK